MIKHSNILAIFLVVSVFVSPFRLPSGLHFAHFFLLVVVFVLSVRRSLVWSYFDFLWLIGCVKLIIDIFLYGGVNVDMKYYMSFLFYAISLRFLFSLRPRVVISKGGGFYFFAGMSVHAVLVITQFVLFNYFSDYSLLNLYGAYSPVGPDPTANVPGPYNPMFQNIKRPNGLNWEPSAAAFWHIYTVACLVSSADFKFKRLFLLVNYVAIFSTFSVLAWGGAAGVFLSGLLVKKGWGKIYLLPFILLVVSTYGVWGGVLGDRLSEIGKSETSGYLRVVAPAVLAMNNFSVLGAAPLGDKSYQDEEGFDGRGRTEMSGIANTYIEFYFYFGLVGLIAIAVIFAKYSKGFSSLGLPIQFCMLYTPLFGGYMLNAIYIYSVVVFIIFYKLFLRGHELNVGVKG
jgi:hypothetical protein